MAVRLAPAAAQSWQAAVLIALCVAASTLQAAGDDNDAGPNMNGQYILSQTPGAHGTQAKFPQNFRDYPRGVSSFDVYSPEIETLYSQVFWKGLPPVALPPEVVSRFDGKGMAVVGFEVDQVRKTDNGDVSVPITVAYNHHFETTMVGKHGYFEKAVPSGPDDPLFKHHDMGHGLPAELWLVRDRGTSDGRLPIKQDFGAANGGEYRKSFHGYAPGFAQVLESPTHIQITPMQIDTWHREKMNLTYPTRFVPGPLPRSSDAPPDALYSGLLECPITTRIRKIVDGGYGAQVTGKCPQAIETAAECFAAARTLQGEDPLNLTLQEGSDSSQPSGCSATADSQNRGSVRVFFNRATETADCGTHATVFSGSVASLVKIGLGIDSEKDVVTITLTGPTGVWFGVGFNATEMADAPWTIIVDGNGEVSERHLAFHDPGTLLKASVKVVSSSVVSGQRTVVLERPLAGATPQYYTFRAGQTMMPLINAVGSTPTLSYHKNKAPVTAVLLPVQAEGVAGACICAHKLVPFGQAKGKLAYVKTSQPADTGSGTINFPNKCAPWPRTDLLDMKNPTCDVRAYAGGQSACHHMFSLLDADQEIPWAQQPIRYHLKFRFWVQEYDPSYHSLVKRTTWGIASPVEYDVPKCAPGILGCSQQQDGTWIHTITGTFTGGGRLVAAHFHCHAPTCLSISMYRCPKGTKVCNATSGELLCREQPVYGGTGRVEEPKFDETGYILQPPCLWGSSEFGLDEPPEVSGYVIGSVKTANATYGHHGEMAWLQMLFVDSPRLPRERPGILV